MALPSILLLLAFVGGIFATAVFTLVLAIGPDCVRQQQCSWAASSARLRRAIAAGAAWLHWRRFRVPITIAAGAAAVAAIAVGLLFAALGQDDRERRRT